jgi:hypothetical protein
LRADGADPAGVPFDRNPAELQSGDSEMMKMLWSPLRRWWRAEADVPVTPLPQVFRRPAPRSTRAGAGIGSSLIRPRQALTPFAVRPVPSRAVLGARRAARRFWMTLDPQDRRRAAIGGSFAEVCAALERLAALEERHAG